MVKAVRSSTAAKTTSRAASKKVEASSAPPDLAKATRRRPAPKAAAKTAPGATIASEAIEPAAKPTARRAKAAPRAVATKRAGRPPAARKATAAPKVSKSGAATPSSSIDLGFLSDFVSFHLRLAQDASYRAFARVKERDLVKPGRFPALAIIHLNPGISQSALGRAIARDKSTVSPLIKDLQKNGLISRKPSPNDRRSVTLALTKKGERVLDRLHARALEHESDLDKLIGTSKGRLVSLLDKITSGVAA